jgi:hypothetical protein
MTRLKGRVFSSVIWVVFAAATPLHAQTDLDRSSSLIGMAFAAQEPRTKSAATPLFDFGQVVQQPAGPAPTPRHTGIKALFKDLVSDVAHLPSKENLLWVGVGSGLALAAHPFDDNVNRYMVGNTTAEKVFKPGRIIGSLGTLLGSASTVYAVGRIKDAPKVSHVGMDLIQSLALAEGLTQTLKYTTRRDRPDHSARTSFPSGHASDTFAFATALERHLGWRGAAPAYALASYVAISRLPANRHWLSDTVFGAAVGIIAGRTVTANETNKYPLTIATVPGGAAVMYVRRARSTGSSARTSSSGR